MQQSTSLNIVVIGAGGIGYHLVEPLTRFISSSAPDYRITVVDGDRVESSNLSRQHESSAVNLNKADVLSAVINKRLQLSKPVQAVSKYISPTTIHDEEFRDLITNNCHIFVCVDNNATRMFIEELVSRLPNCVMISGGNDLLKGQVQLYVRQNNQDRTPKPSEVNPEIAAEDQFPDEVGCDQLVVSEPQLVFTNNTIACTMLSMWYSYTQEAQHSSEPIVNEVCANIMKSSAFPYVRSSLKTVVK